MTKKIVFGVLAVVVIAGGGWWYFQSNQSGSQAPTSSAPAPLVASQNVQPAPAPTPGTPNSVIIPATGSSDDSLTQESAAVDAQIDGLNADSAKADAGLSSQ